MTLEYLALMGFVTGLGIGSGFAGGLAIVGRMRALARRWGPKRVAVEEPQDGGKRGRTRKRTKS